MLVPGLTAQETGALAGLPTLSVEFSAGASLPVGTASTFFKPGFFVEAGPVLMLKDGLGAELDIDHAVLPLTAGPTLTSRGAGIGVRYVWKPLDRLSLIG
jgi:hypothetical protein